MIDVFFWFILLIVCGIVLNYTYLLIQKIKDNLEKNKENKQKFNDQLSDLDFDPLKKFKKTLKETKQHEKQIISNGNFSDVFDSE